MAAKLTFQYDREAGVHYITKRPPYPEQRSEELGDDVVARLNPATASIEGLEILFFSVRLGQGGMELPVDAELKRAG